MANQKVKQITPADQRKKFLSFGCAISNLHKVFDENEKLGKTVGWKMLVEGISIRYEIRGFYHEQFAHYGNRVQKFYQTPKECYDAALVSIGEWKKKYYKVKLILPDIKKPEPVLVKLPQSYKFNPL